MRPLRYVLPLFATCIFASGATTATAGSDIGVGVFAGLNYPLVQDDAESGNIFGVRGSYSLSSITVQPYVAFSAIGDYEIVSILGTSTFDGGDLTIFGLDATLGGGGAGMSVYLHAGIGSYKLEYDNPSGSLLGDTRVGYSGGLGINYGMTNSPLAIDVRAALAVIPLEDGGSRKYFLPTIGFGYSFGGGVK